MAKKTLTKRISSSSTKDKTTPPTKKLNRYAYEKAEAVLDAYVASTNSRMMFRAYQQFKWLLYGLAHIDYSHGGATMEMCLSYAWEDAQIGFTGYGTEIMSGAVMALWSNLDEDHWDDFHKAATKAFKEAEEATSDEVVRRYLPRFRKKPVRRLDEGFDLPCVVPLFGTAIRDWAADTGEDPDVVTDRMLWIERATQELMEDHQDEVKKDEPKKKKPALMLVPNNDDTFN